MAGVVRLPVRSARKCAPDFDAESNGAVREWLAAQDFD